MERRIGLNVSRFASVRERAPSKTRLPIMTTLLPESGHTARPEISFRTRLSGDTGPAAEEGLPVWDERRYRAPSALPEGANPTLRNCFFDDERQQRRAPEHALHRCSFEARGAVPTRRR